MGDPGRGAGRRWAGSGLSPQSGSGGGGQRCPSWCPACQEAEPKLKQLGRDNPEFVTLKVDIDQGESPVAKQYGIKTIPRYRVYDAEGKMLSEGKEARAQVRAWLGQP